MGGSVSSLRHERKRNLISPAGNKTNDPISPAAAQDQKVNDELIVKDEKTENALLSTLSGKKALLQQCLEPPSDIQILRRDNKVKNFLFISKHVL